MISSKELGGNFSQLQCKYLGFNEEQTLTAFQEILGLGLGVMRLGSYWNEIEPKQGEYNFRVLNNLLNEAVNHPVKVALTVGIKGPRHPEFFIPDWVKERFPDETAGKIGALGQNPKFVDLTLKFVEKVLNETSGCPNITHYQIENEPFVKIPFASVNEALNPELISNEAKLVKSLKRDDQKVLFSMAVNPTPFPFFGFDDTAHFNKSIELADAIGFNIYSRVALGTFVPLPFLNKLYIEPTASKYYWSKISAWRQKLEELGKEAWVTESQAEPWETGNFVHKEKREYQSVNPQRASDLATKLLDTGFSPVLLWGCEHWYFHKMQGHKEWWNEMQKLVERNTND